MYFQHAGEYLSERQEVNVVGQEVEDDEVGQPEQDGNAQQFVHLSGCHPLRHDDADDSPDDDA